MYHHQFDIDDKSEIFDKFFEISSFFCVFNLNNDIQIEISNSMYTIWK